MEKIISLFKRDYEGTRLIYPEVVPGAEWVTDGEGVATRKFDGTCCLVEDGKLFKRYEVKRGKTPPDNFVPATDVDETTGKQQGWVPVGDGQEDKWHREAWDKRIHEEVYLNGTYELIGEKIQGNPEGISNGHVLIKHGDDKLEDVPRDFDGLKHFLSLNNIEGIVWHHPDGRMVKIKGKDFGIKRANLTQKEEG